MTDKRADGRTHPHVEIHLKMKILVATCGCHERIIQFKKASYENRFLSVRTDGMDGQRGGKIACKDAIEKKPFDSYSLY